MLCKINRIVLPFNISRVFLTSGCAKTERSQRGMILFKASKANKASIHRIAFDEKLLLATSLPSENHHHPLITHTNQPPAIRTPAHLRRGKMCILVR